MWLIAKRLQKGRFVWPPLVDGSMSLTPAQLSVLVEAMEWRRTSRCLCRLRRALPVIGPACPAGHARCVLRRCAAKFFEVWEATKSPIAEEAVRRIAKLSEIEA
jgi:hypothetical protein